MSKVVVEYRIRRNVKGGGMRGTEGVNYVAVCYVTLDGVDMRGMDVQGV
jgi:hypothetical protein